MNFCQKHINHHCVHSHSCQNKDHKKLNQQRKHNINKTINNNHSQKNILNKCKFVRHSSNTQNINKQLLSKLHQNQLKICELAYNQTKNNQKCDKFILENKHLYAQIEYYRQQFASLISTYNADNKNQIKKRVQQSTDFILKIKVLLSQNDSLKVQNQQLKQIIEYHKKQQVQSQNKYKILYEKYQSTVSKLKQLNKHKIENDETLINRQKTYNKLNEHYDILKSQFNFQRQKYIKQNKKVNDQLQIMKKQFNKYKNLIQKQKQILILERDSFSQKQDMYKQKMQEFQKVNHELKRKLKEINQKNQDLEEDLKYARKVLQKKQDIKGQITTINKQLQNKTVQKIEKNTQIRQNFSHQKQNKTLQQKDTNYNEENLKLKQQIKRLTEKCSQLQSRSHSSYQEIVMNIGASQAFKKLVHQKNEVIKKLMRQKGAIYAKLQNHYH